ncbi:MAG: hypothetical protein IKI77_09030 [Oscillospiraceae bacterium]|nr:hypothetical protein [Oscillospiraceae bacterium]
MQNSTQFNQLFQAGVMNPASEHYLWLPEMEFLSPEVAGYRRQLFEGVCDLTGLTVFAVTGGGDLFCWDAEDSVFLVPHDGGDPAYFAADLGDAVYRRLLEFSADLFENFCSDQEKAAMQPEDAESVISETEALGMLRDYDAGFADLLSQEQHDVLRTLVRGGFDDEGVLLTPAACAALIYAMNEYDQ